MNQPECADRPPELHGVRKGMGTVAARPLARVVSAMSRSRRRRYAALVVVTALLGGAFLFWGDEHAQETMVITRATPDQLANAMHRDAFFSDYGASTLLIEATVASVVTRAGATTVTLVTTSSSTLACDLGQVSTTTHVGDTGLLVAQGAAARRQSAGFFFGAAPSRARPGAQPSPACLNTLPIPTARSAGA